MKITAIFFSSSFATIALALPAAQYNDHWSGFFGPDPGYYQYGGGTPYYPSQLAPPGGANGQIPPPAVPPSMIEPISYGRPYENSGSSRLPPPPYPYGGNYEDPGPLRLPQPPQPPPIQYPQAPPPPPPGPLDGPVRRPAGPNQPSQPAAPLTPKFKLGKPVSEKPRDKKPLADRFTPELEDPLPAPPPPPPPPRSPLLPQRAVVEDDVNSDDFDKDAIRYHVNVGGIQKGGGGGTTNFHVYSDENGNKRFSEHLDEETEKYITENMIPKLGGKRKGGNRGGIWSVFGDN